MAGEAEDKNQVNWAVHEVSKAVKYSQTKNIMVVRCSVNTAFFIYAATDALIKIRI